jgi:hypothetical protein
VDGALTSPGQGASSVGLALRRSETMQRWFPNDPTARGRLGLAYFRSNAHQQAVRTLERPDLWRPQGRAPGADAAVLAMSYHRLNQTEKARSYLETAHARLKEMQARMKGSTSAAPASVRFMQQEASRTQELVQESERLLRGSR